MAETPLWSMSIICKNEEGSLPNLMKSMKHFTDAGGEVVVVDTGSTDNTIQVLHDHGFVKISDNSKAQLRYEEVDDRFVFHIDNETVDKIHKKFLVGDDKKFAIIGKKVFNFGAARRYAGSLCSNKWILSIDCDEVFSALNIQFLNHIIKTGDVDQLSFVFRYRNGDGGIASVTSRDKFYNREVSDWKWVVHEQAVALPGKTVRSVAITEGTISVDHYQHPAEHRSNYLVQMCIDVMEYPDNDRHTHWLGREMLFKGIYNGALKLLKWHIRNPEFKKAWGAEKCMSCLYIGDTYIALSARTDSNESSQKIELEQKALSWYFSGTFYEKNFREPWMKLAEFYQQANDHLRAVQYVQAALMIKDVQANYMNNPSYYKTKPYDILYWGLYWIGRHEEAYRAWTMAKSMDPTNPRYASDERLFTEFIKK